jgi:hypothetical protein
MYSRWLRQLELKAWRCLTKAGHHVDEVITHIAHDVPGRSDLEIWMRQSQIGAIAFPRLKEDDSSIQSLMSGEPILFSHII